MDEHFLHHIWKYQKFNTSDLKTSTGLPIKVFDPGFHNFDSGPDFEEARLKIDDIEWVGQVEIHVNASDWHKHGHSLDAHYNNVILHVVWNHDDEVLLEDEILPVLELKRLVDHQLIHSYQHHIQSPETIACGTQLAQVPSLIIHSMLDKAAIERLERKATTILNQLARNGNDWEEVTYQTLMVNFGFSTNKEPFQTLLGRLPYPILKKNLANAENAQALLFGQAGFLNDPNDDYSIQLQMTFHYLSKKFKLQDPLSIQEWKFGRMRPSNFPTVRLAQVATLFHFYPKLFGEILKIDEPKDIIPIFQFDLPEYWQQHYAFGTSRITRQKQIGRSTMENLLINSVSPILAAYSKYTGNQNLMEKAVRLLELLKPENNRHIKEWKYVKIDPRNAFESQALIQISQEYCKKRKCLNCNIGMKILSQ